MHSGVAAVLQRIAAILQQLRVEAHCFNIAAMRFNPQVAAIRVLHAMAFNIAAMRIAAILKAIAAILPLLHYNSGLRVEAALRQYCSNIPIFSRCTRSKLVIHTAGTCRNRLLVEGVSGLQQEVTLVL